MKRVKLMLSAIAVFAVVGGALAFKAKDPSFHRFTVVGTTCLSDGGNYTLDASQPKIAGTVTDADLNGSISTGNCDGNVSAIPE